jgi:hypothetical protein
MQRCCATEIRLALPTSKQASTAETYRDGPDGLFGTIEANIANLIE